MADVITVLTVFHAAVGTEFAHCTLNWLVAADVQLIVIPDPFRLILEIVGGAAIGVANAERPSCTRKK